MENYLRGLAAGMQGMGALAQPPGALEQRSPQGILARALNEPLPMEGRLNFLPARITPQGREFALPGILAGAWNAFTAPGRAYSGNMADPVGEALNFAGMLQMGAMPSPAVGGPGTLGMNVYHGSPHKFDKFDMSKVGTGEGAQAYGHGLYFAENPQVASAYRVAGIGATPDIPKQGPIFAAQTLLRHKSESEALNLMKTAYPELGEAGVKDAVAKAKAGLNAHSTLYKVDLPDEQIAKMLDWDKPLSQQPEAVKPVLKAMLEKARKSFQQIDPAGDPTAGQVHHLYAQHRGGNAVAVAQELRAAGIPGIRYLDQGSRSGGKGTSNFVVFDDSIPKIIGRE